MSERYATTHEWARAEGNSVVLGLSAFAAGEVGEVIHVQLPQVGARFAAGESMAEIESVKSVNDFYAPIACTITAVNPALETNPELVNSDPTGKGWFVEVKPSNVADVQKMLSADEYAKHIKK